MTFWIFALALSALVAAVVLRALLRTETAPGDVPDSPDVAVYKAQLAELDRDLARGVLPADEAERTRAEIARRLLAADAAARKKIATAPRWLTYVAAAVIALACIAGGYALYRWLGVPGYPDIPRAERLARADEMRATRPGQRELEAIFAADLAAQMGEVPPEVEAELAELRAAAGRNPDDIATLRKLVIAEAGAGSFAAAARAQSRIVALTGGADIRDRIAELDMMVFATNFFVSPEAEALARQILEEDPDNVAARFHLGALYDRTDRPDLAMAYWAPIIAEATEPSLHVNLARSFIEDAAFRAGIDYRLPPAPWERGPSAADMAAAADMAPEDREAMIRGMVAGLEDRLATEGGPAEDWARLVTSLGVLGETERARAILAEARQAFEGDRGAQALLDQAEAALDQ